MQKIVSFLLVSAAVLLFSCGNKRFASVESSSPNGKVTVIVEGRRSIPFDPFKTEIRVKEGGSKEGKLVFEVMANDLNGENVKFNWQGDTACTITIEESDKHARSFRLTANENEVQLEEI